MAKNVSTNPRSNASPKAPKAPRAPKANNPVPETVENNSASTEENAGVSVSDSVVSNVGPNDSANNNEPSNSANEDKTMELTFKRLPDRKDSRLVLFGFTDGRRGQVQFQRSAFPEAGIPETIKMSGDFSEPKVAAAPMTAEERKAKRAAAPKLTLAEKVAKADAKAAKLRAKLAAAATPATETSEPVAEPATV